MRGLDPSASEFKPRDRSDSDEFKWYESRGRAHSDSHRHEEVDFVTLDYPPRARAKTAASPSRKSKAGTSLSFNIYDRKVSPALQKAFDCIYGMPFRGSFAYAGVLSVDSSGSVLIVNSKSQVKTRHSGLASVEVQIHWKQAQTEKSMKIAVRSAGYDDGNFAEILLDGKEYSNDASGLNVVIMDLGTCEIVSESFDTHSIHGDEEVDRFLTFSSAQLKCSVEQVVATKLLLIASKDECAKNLKLRAQELLRQLGAEIPPRDDHETLLSLIHSGELPWEKTPSLLNVCAKADAENCMKTLLDNDWRIDYRPKHGIQNTALHDAIYHDSMKCIRVLLEEGINYKVRNKVGETAENMILKKYQVTVEEFLASPGSLLEKETEISLSLPSISSEEAIVSSVLRTLDLSFVLS